MDPWFVALAALAALLPTAVVAAEPEHVAPAVNTVDPNAPIGRRPYEMEWANRQEERTPLVSFEDLSGWTVAMWAGCVAELRLSREQQMWGQHVAKLTYRGIGPDSRCELRPPGPIPLPRDFTAVNLWCYGNNWDWEPDPTTPQVELFVHLADANGNDHRIRLARVRWKEWWLIHKHLTPAELASMPPPRSFTGIEVAGAANAQDRAIFLDSLAVYREALRPLTFEPRPARGVDPFPGQGQGLNGTGPGRLPFPTRQQTILPSNFASGYRTSVTRGADGVYVFAYRGPDASVHYSVDPAKGWRGIVASVDGSSVARPLVGGGVEWNGAVAPAELISASVSGRTLTCRYKAELGTVEYTYRMWGKSLVIDAKAPAGATGLSLGRMEGVTDPRPTVVPYLTLGSNPAVLVAGSREKPVFASVWVDWYRSNASELYAAVEKGDSYARINGGVRYNPKTDGQRNPLFERIFLTVSPTFEETLPTIANPPSPWGKVAGERLWQESWGPQDFAKEHERSRRLRSYGIDKLIQCNHEIAWRDGGESFTLRIHAAPAKGGDDALAEFVCKQKALGWREGLYTNYTDYAPVNEHWDEDGVQLTPDGEWRTAWPRCYALKPSRAVEWEARLAPIIKKRYDPNAAYTDVHTAVAPWAYCDYDARVPGAGTFAATFYAYGELLLNDKKVYGGPIFSEGTYQGLYAGLTDGNYGLAYNGVNLSEVPIVPHFDLLKIHPLECDIGMPWTSHFFGDKPGWNAPDVLEHSIDRFLAATIAYGHIGWLVEEAHGISLTCRSYYMLQQLQKRYSMVPVSRIEYNDGGKLVDSSHAIASGAYAESQLHIAYRNGLELWVNGSRSSNWEVLPPGEADPILLPPAGWLAIHKATNFRESSALEGGGRVDRVLSPEYLFLDGRGRLAHMPGVSGARGAAVKPLPDGVEVIDTGGNQEIVLSPLNGAAASTPIGRAISSILAKPPTSAAAFDADGNQLRSAQLRARDGAVAIETVPGAVRYLLAAAR